MVSHQICLPVSAHRKPENSSNNQNSIFEEDHVVDTSRWLLKNI